MMSFPRGPLSPAAREQQLLWGSNPSHWARFAEPHTRPLFEAILAATSVTAGTRLLDASCGSGLLLAMAAARGLEAGLAAAGRRVEASGEVVCVWRYDSVAGACRGLLSSAGGTRAAQDAGREAACAAIEKAVAPFTDPATGVISMRNVFRWVSAAKITAAKITAAKVSAAKVSAAKVSAWHL
jgi:hypothetical protein